MKTHIKSLYVTIALLAFLLGWILIRENYAGRLLNRINKPPAKKNTYWLNRDELFECFPSDSNAIIFLGTSLTQQFELAELFHNSEIKNRGIVGDITESALLRLSPIVRCHPKKIFIELGINDLLENIDKDTVVKNYNHLVDRILLNSPGTQIYIQSILPVSAGPAISQDLNSKEFNEKINYVNDKLFALSRENNLKYIDVAKDFMVNGELDSRLTFDGVHLNGKAYLLWRDILKPCVEE